ncbi:hypothetical protein [Henriciella litoralis]|uniref:hypothetical protein n=1 Tax=Henriciella litoralis TaxID=568102 RepID=UPI000A012563|nr:hypothetical protein [Henriciella litoralis]
MKSIFAAAILLTVGAGPAVAEGIKPGSWIAAGGQCDAPALSFGAPEANGYAMGAAVIDGARVAVKTGELSAPSFLVNPDTADEYLVRADWDGTSVQLIRVLGAPMDSVKVGGVSVDGKTLQTLTRCPDGQPPQPAPPPAAATVDFPMSKADLIGHWGSSDENGNAGMFPCTGDTKYGVPGTMQFEGRNIEVYGSYVIFEGADGQLYKGNPHYLSPIQIVNQPVAYGIAYRDGENTVVMKAVNALNFRMDQNRAKVFAPLEAMRSGNAPDPSFMVYKTTQTSSEEDTSPFTAHVVKCVVR